MKHQALRHAALMLSVLLAAVVPTQAGTITLADVAKAFADGQSKRPSAEFRLRSIAQNGSVPLSSDASSAQSGNQSSPSNGSQNETQSTSTPNGNGNVSLIDTAQTPQQGGTVETIDLGDVTGTVCDCGEIPVLRTPGGFPKWPLLALAGIPFLFFPGGEDDIPPPPGPPPPPPPGVPEPATILLFGSSLMALGAGARRRRAQKQLDGQTVVTTPEEV